MINFENMKPLGYKAYGSIPHLPGSRLGVGDHHCHDGQAKIATEKKRDRHDIIIVQEKLDGSNCAIAKLNEEIIALGRAGYLAESSKYSVHHSFNKYVEANKKRFSELLNEGERLCGEYLAQAVGTRYELTHEPFVAFDLMTGKIRTPYQTFKSRVEAFGIPIPHTLSIGEPMSIERAIELLEVSGHGAIDKVEGAIWRVERKGEVDFLVKYVRHDKEDGKYFAEKNEGKIVWNCEDFLPHSSTSI